MVSGQKNEQLSFLEWLTNSPYVENLQLVFGKYLPEGLESSKLKVPPLRNLHFPPDDARHSKSQKHGDYHLNWLVIT